MTNHSAFQLWGRSTGAGARITIGWQCVTAPDWERQASLALLFVAAYTRFSSLHRMARQPQHIRATASAVVKVSLTRSFGCEHGYKSSLIEAEASSMPPRCIWHLSAVDKGGGFSLPLQPRGPEVIQNLAREADDARAQKGHCDFLHARSICLRGIRTGASGSGFC